ncbi:MAG TPA: winged helix-turn-helix domain-containing protein [Terriglobales bacterium]|nr:winged helix-turn-helix domain-containing protein [Terriglobales bacterium]
MSEQTKVLYEFGRFRCDPGEHLLLRNGRPLPLSPKAFEILVVLIQSNGRLMTKDELMHKVWPDTFVEEANLTVNISALRKVLGENPEGQPYIETVPKRGYRFLSPVIELGSDRTSVNVPAQASNSQQGVAIGRSAAWQAWSRRLWIAAGLMLLAIMVVLLVSSRPAKLTDKDTVVLADFANSTGDPVFDDALRQGLSSQLEQSPFLNLLSDDRIAKTLSLMSRPKDARLTHEVAREVCERTASAAVLDGTIAQVGEQYLLTLKAINCSTGESLGSAEETASDKDHILAALSKLASGIRSQVGESLASVQKYDAPAENVTTPSLEALKAYSLGYQAMVVKSDYGAAIPLFQRAISLDPNFAMAYARMGTSYFNLYQTVAATESDRRAYQLREHLSERERLYIAAHYQIVVTGNLEAASKACEVLAETYPREAPYTNLGIIYSQLGDYDKALSAFESAVRIGPGTGTRYANLVNGYLQLNRVNDALAAVQKAKANQVDSPEIHVNLYWSNFLKQDTAGMEREAAAVIGKPGYEDQMLNYESDTALYRGQLANARDLSRRAIASAQKEDDKEVAAVYEAQAAVREALVGNTGPAKEQAHAAVASSHGRDAEGLSAIALGLAGDSKSAARLADDLGKRFSEDTIAQFTYLPIIRAAGFLGDGNSRRAIEALSVAAPYELGGNLLTLNFVLYAVYVRGEAYLQAKQGAAAAAEFQKILDHPGAVRSEPIGALAQLELGRAFALAGEKKNAKNAYGNFLTLWRGADAEIAILKQANEEYAKL